jgi:hypothetical protein
LICEWKVRLVFNLTVKDGSGRDIFHEIPVSELLFYHVPALEFLPEGRNYELRGRNLRSLAAIPRLLYENNSKRKIASEWYMEFEPVLGWKGVFDASTVISTMESALLKQFGKIMAMTLSPDRLTLTVAVYSHGVVHPSSLRYTLIRILRPTENPFLNPQIQLNEFGGFSIRSGNPSEVLYNNLHNGPDILSKAIMRFGNGESTFSPFVYGVKIPTADTVFTSAAQHYIKRFNTLIAVDAGGHQTETAELAPSLGPVNEEDAPDSHRVISLAFSRGGTIGGNNNQSQLSCAGQWIPENGTCMTGNMKNVYLQIKIVTPGAYLCGIVTLGRGDNTYETKLYWVTSYTVQISTDGVNFVPFKPFEIGEIFPGNVDRTTKKTNHFSPVRATHVRIYPLTSNSYVCLRAGLLVRSPLP